MTLALTLGAVLALVAVAFVARPFLREPAPASDRLDELSGAEQARLEIVEERDRALAALKELEFDHRTGKVTDVDYREQIGPLRQRAAAALKALDSRVGPGDERSSATESCPSCNAEIPLSARFCPECGTKLHGDGDTMLEVALPPEETGPVPVTMQRAETRWFGVAPPTALLVAAGLALFAAIALFASKHWPFGLILLGIAALLLAAFMEAARHRPHAEPAPPRRGSGLGERSRSAWEELRARSAAAAEVKRLQSALLLVDSDRRQALHELGAAAHARNSHGEAAARARLTELDEQEAELRRQLDEQTRVAGERIRKAKLPVQDTMMVVPPQPAPPPGEATPPQPATVPEPYPPPDEGNPPEPARIPEPTPDAPRED